MSRRALGRLNHAAVALKWPFETDGSATNDGHLEVRGVHHHGAVLRAVEFADELQEFRAHASLTLGIQSREDACNRKVGRAQLVDPIHGRAAAEGNPFRVCLDVSIGTKQLLYTCFCSPIAGHDSRAPRRVTNDDLEQLADEAIR